MNADDINVELDQLIKESNDQDNRIVALEIALAKLTE